MKKRVILLSIILLVIGVIFINNRKKEEQILDVNSLNISEENTPVLAMYKNDGGEDEKITTMPEDGYEIDTDRSYCYTTNKNEPDDVDLHTNSDGEHIISRLKKGSKCFLYFKKELPPLEQSLANLGLKTDDVIGTPTSFTGTACGTSDCADVNKTAGLYKGTDDDGDTYYYRGNVTNNWVKFAGMYWRIIRINGDGTIRLIYSGETAQTKGTETQLPTTNAFNKNSNDNKYVGYMYTPSGTTASTSYPTTAAANSAKSTILVKIEDWYNKKLKNDYADKIEGNTGFCGDRALSQNSHGEIYTTVGSRGFGENITAYRTLDRAWQSGDMGWAERITPTFKCSNKNRDLYTTSGSERGNKKLPVPVGLITMDEVIFAGGYPGKTNQGSKAYYLYTEQFYWTMSPFEFMGHAYVFMVHDNGSLDGVYNVSYTNGVRPVINLKAGTNFKFTNDDTKGTANNPYEVV